MGPVREPAVAGTFYPEDPRALREMIRDFLDRSESVSLPGPPLAVLAPHAGYIYSGAVAASVYRLLRNRSYETVVVLAPSHRVPFRGASVLPQGAYRTPLGLIPVDEEVCQRLLRADPLLIDFPEAHVPEHALEVQLPFLQEVLSPGWNLVPVVMGSQDFQTAQVLARSLREALAARNRALVVASSDLSHYRSAEEAETMDRRAIRFMEDLDARGLWEAAQKGEVEACGIGPILVSLLMAKEAGVLRGTQIRYAHSGHVTGDRSRVVGYTAMVWALPAGAGGKEGKTVGVDLGLTEEEKRILKEIARTAITSRLEGKPIPKVGPLTETLKEPRGAFVTLEKHHQLRGCIGLIEAIKPLHETVREMALAAAFQDPRFPPLTKEEWPEVEIEISVLTPFRRIHDPLEIQVGLHGIYLIKGLHRGLLLPQVATEYGWDRETFLEHTCLKAGLPPRAWKDPETEIYVFSADIF